MRIRLPPTAATETPNPPSLDGMGLVKVVNNEPSVLKRCTPSGYGGGWLIFTPLMINRSFPTAAIAKPKACTLAGEGLVKVVSNVPLVSNKKAAPAGDCGAPGPALNAPIKTRSLPTAATPRPAPNPS